MRDMSTHLFELIKKELTINEICELLNLSNKQIYNILRMIENKGFEFDRKYYDNGNIIYKPKSNIKPIKQTNYVDIITENNNDFTAVAISDLHIGNEKQRLDAINKVYDYCAKTGIHNIFICGDLIDGTYGDSNKIIKNPEQQIEFLLNNYPFDNSILNYAVLGDHDYSLLQKTSQNLATTLKNYRHDIIPIGFGFGEINIKKGKIVLMHKFGYKYQNEYNAMTSAVSLHNDLVLQGHYHSPFSIENKKSNYIVNIPSLSDMRNLNAEPLPSAIKFEIQFHKNFYSQINFSKLLIDNNTVVVDENCKCIKLKTKNSGKKFF